MSNHRFNSRLWPRMLLALAMLVALVLGFITSPGDVVANSDNRAGQMSPLAALSLVTNGDFSAGSTGWSTSGSVSFNSGVVYFSGGDAPINGVLWQQISAVNGQSYVLDYDVARRGAGGGTPRALVEVLDAGTNAVITSTMSAGGAQNVWVHFTLAFVASGPVIIRFVDQSTATVNLDLGLDNVAVLAPAGCVPQPPNLVSWWRAQGDAKDFIGSNNGSLVNGATFTTTGVVGEAFNFNGANQYVSVPSTTTLEMRNDLTVLAWFKVNSLASGGHAKVFSKRPGSTFGPFEIDIENSGGTITAYPMGSTTGAIWDVNITTPPTITLGTWYHTAFVVDDSNLHSFYLDGQLKGTRQLSAQLMSHAGAALLFGISGGGFPLNGAVDEVMIFNRALSATEIQRLYNSGSSGVCPGPNDAPVAVDDDASTNEDTPLTIAPSAGVLGNDTDVNTNPLYAAKVSDPAHGALAFNIDGSFTYTPTANYNGSDSFTYQASDGVADSNVATVTLTVTATNDAPVAVNDAYNAAEDTSLTIVAPGVLGNDTDIDGDALTAVKVSDPAHGALTFNLDGSFVYTPTAGYNGSDSFTYQANDGLADSNVATVTIAVLAPAGCVLPLADLVSWWHAEGNADDALAANPGTLENGTSFAAGLAGQAFNFNGGNQYVNIPNSQSIELPNGLTVMAWFKADTFAYQASSIFGIAASSIWDGSQYVNTGNAYNVYVINDEDFGPIAAVRFTSAGGSQAVINTPIVSGRWYHAAISVDGSNIAKLYLNGQLIGARSLPAPLQDYGVMPLTIGAFIYNGALGNAIDGLVDEVQIAHRALSPAEIQSAYNRCAAPTAVDDSYRVNENTPLTIAPAAGVLSNDMDMNNDALTAAKVSDPAHGALAFNLDGSFIYTPTAGYTGVDTFTYKASNGVFDSNVAAVTVTVNGAPVAVNDTYTAIEDTPLTIDSSAGVLGNDSDVDGDIITATKISDPAHGALAFNIDGSFTYTPTADYNGSDSFTYQASDGVADSNVATVTLTVTATNDAPVAVNDVYTTTEDTPLTIVAPGVLGNDTDIDGDALTAVKVSDPAHGALTFNLDGSFTYTPTADYNGSDSFTYQASDGVADSNVATVTLTVIAANDAPVAVNDVYTTTEDTPLTIVAPGVLGNDTDIDGDALTAVKVSNPAHGALAFNLDGSFIYTPTADYNGSDSFTYQASDGVADSNVATVTLTVIATNDAPVAVNDVYTTTEDTPLTIVAPGVLGNDTDVDGDLLTAVKVSDPAHGALAFNTNGSFVYTPTANYNGSDGFTYQANDGTVDSNVATVSLTVTAVNDAPVAVNDAYTTIEDTPLTVAAPGVLGNDTDVESNPLTAVKVSDPAHGTLAFSADGSFVYTPTANYNGDDSFTYKANDGTADSNVAMVTLTVTAVNDAPVAVNDGYTATEDMPLTIFTPGVLVNDSDVDGDALTAVKVSDPAHGEVTLNLNGSLVYTPALNYNGDDSFTYKANDGTADSNVATVTLTVTAVNDAPVAVNDAYTTTEDTPLTIAAPGMLGNDTDVDGDPLWVKWYYLPSHGDLTLYNDGSFVYTPASDFAGTDTFTYQATDGVENSNWATVTLTVTAVNDAPVAVNDAYTATEDTPLTITAPGVLVNDTDVDGDPLWVKWYYPPSHGDLTLYDDGSFVYTPAPDFAGTDTFTYQATDGVANSNWGTVTFTVTAVDDAPVAVNDNYTTDYETALTVGAPGVLGNDINVDADSLTVVKVSDPAHGELTLNADGSFTYTPTVSYSGSDSFTYQANDGSLDSNVATVDIMVLPPVGDVGLLGYWKFDEGSGATAADSSDYHNNGTLSGGATFTTTAAPVTYYADPGSLSVSSVTTGVVTVTNSAVNRLTNNFTVMGWIKPSSVSGYQRVIATARTKSNNGWNMGLWYGTLLFSTNGKKDYYSSSSSSGLKAGQWYHIAAVMDSSNAVTFYLDGVSIGTVTGTVSAVADTDDVLQIGGSTASGGSALTEPFNGLIDDLRVYDHALTASDIADLVGVPPCSEPVFRARVLLGEISASKTITLDGTCTYTMTYADSSWSGGTGVYLNSATTIEGNGATIARDSSAPMFRLLTASPALTIRNLTLRGGNVYGSGAALYAWGNLTLSNVRFENNTAANTPGATYVNTAGAVYATANLTVERSFFIGNQTGGYGGAIYFAGLTGRIANTVFADNLSGSPAAAIDATNASGNLTLLNNTFADQYKNNREALLLNGTATVQNNIFYNYKTGLTASGAVTVTEDYNLFASDDLDPQSVNGATVLRGGHSRIAISPRFVDPAARNYRLQANSPAIDLGVDAGVATDADGNARPYGTAMDIGAYEYQGVGIPSLSIIKTGPPYAAGTGQTQFVLTVINEGASALDDLRIVEQLPAGATYVAGSASYSGTFNTGALTWDLNPLAPNQMQRVGYKVTATQDLVSDNYSVSSTGTPTITASGPVITTTYQMSATALGFFPFPDGYSFPNTGAAQDSDFNADDMAYTFGAANVCKVTSPACVLNASAEAYRQKMASPNGGHCFGMAMASLWIYDRLDVVPGDYQPGAAITFDLLKGNAWKLIQRFFWTQLQTPVSATVPAFTAATGAAGVVDKLKANYANPAAADRYTISFWKTDWTGGHAVTPYAVKQIDADHYWIYVYDNNYPNNFDRVFKVTYSTQSWVYEGGATAPGAPVSSYTGDGTTPTTIQLKSLRNAENFAKRCTTSNACAPITTTLRLAAQNLQTASSTYDFQLDGEGFLMVTRSDGKRAGVDPTGTFIAEIPGAEQIVFATGLGLNIPNIIRVPHMAGMTYKLSISNRPNAYGNLAATADVTILGEGYVTRLKGLKIDSPADPQATPGANDIVGVTFDGDSHRVIYQSSALDSDTPSLGMAISQANGPDFTFEVGGAQVSSGRSLLAAFDVATGKLTIENNDPSNNTYALDVERINLNGSKTAYHSDAVSDGTSLGAIIDLGPSWTGGAPTITPNNTPSMFHLYLPLVARQH